MGILLVWVRNRPKVFDIDIQKSKTFGRLVFFTRSISACIVVSTSYSCENWCSSVILSLNFKNIFEKIVIQLSKLHILLSFHILCICISLLSLERVVDLLLTIAKFDPDVFKQAHIRAFLAAYNASLAPIGMYLNQLHSFLNFLLFVFFLDVTLLDIKLICRTVTVWLFKISFSPIYLLQWTLDCFAYQQLAVHHEHQEKLSIIEHSHLVVAKHASPKKCVIRLWDNTF